MADIERRAVLTALIESARARTGADPGVRLAEIPHTGKIDLRGGGDVAAAASRALNLDMPREPLGAASNGEVTALWLGPDQWLLTTEPEEQGPLAERLRAALADLHHSIVDVTDRSTIIRLSGARARDVLAKGCPLDLHPRAFAVDRVAQSLVGKVDVILHQTGGEPSFDLYVQRSFADYLFRFLEEAASEYGFVLDP